MKESNPNGRSISRETAARGESADSGIAQAPSQLSIVIPAYNEALSVREGILEVQKAFEGEGYEIEIIVVDDGSADETASEAKIAGARVIQHRRNRGYGASLKTGIIAASYDFIAITDADGTYPAEYLPEMLRKLEHADMVVGARTGSDVNIPLVRRPAKWFLRMIANYVANTKIPDLNSGLRVFRKDVAMQYFAILSDQFSFTTTITLALLCDKYAVVYTPIDYRKRTGKSKITPFDAGNFAILILRVAMLFRPLRVFLPIALMSLLYGIVKMSVDLTRDPNISASATFALVSALMLVLVGMLGDAVAMRLGRFNQYSAMGVRPKELELRDQPEASEAEVSGKEVIGT
ncbi:MAG: glycosyltransferase family 2 protein [Acidobacteria bacterium]|mgnify:CR=1 FL=1|nr:MAG: glycosyltransferase family 2 protein [Acidobacteriota bacterium]REK01178.1 MAG: glycosyltransferase family 2 protein [Acidobacteriota bacterium]REK14134.1 MAG: glycosyltransferase family 2 protein [Acidobacteriota bacterium]REK44849.1 MAG: glycosyltransferase family 2 protein [Acidobacteriota bacterium]